MTEQQKIMEKWTEYFVNLLNCEDLVDELPRIEVVPNERFIPSTV